MAESLWKSQLWGDYYRPKVFTLTEILDQPLVIGHHVLKFDFIIRIHVLDILISSALHRSVFSLGKIINLTSK